MKITFDVEINEAGVEAYRRMYAGTLIDDETVEQTLVREAIAAWEWEDLVTAADQVQP